MGEIPQQRGGQAKDEDQMKMLSGKTDSFTLWYLPPPPPKDTISRRSERSGGWVPRMSPSWPLIFIVMPGRVPQVQWPNPTERKDGRKVGGGSAGKWMII